MEICLRNGLPDEVKIAIRSTIRPIADHGTIHMVPVSRSYMLNRRAPEELPISA